ncbi:hypothetical protein CBR_g12724 [Chara braunii]|uniref:Reverse transcriptase domain-containing protein n=1 Tax=Chara braunii TaxID=69332 RepID=A0A388KSF3_CHABU|nr:hypothetical protein CBR_g12724 [Chara braunii]|eukprot:GBG73005.1 hypothetical protein CBR_g12724 [Chara braunii]
MAKGKAPGEDGLPLEFYKACWSTLAEDLVAVYNETREGGLLGKSIAKGIITLMYKKGDRSEIRNWRPISLLNLSYKLLAKTLANRLAKHLPGLVGLDQGAFVRGRSIVDNLATAIEALEVIEGRNEEVVVLMLDMEKAFDRVNWAFVLTTLKALNFGDAFCSWVGGLYFSSSAVVQVNGYHSEEFELSRSLRQGCPLAPLLFVLQLEVLLHDIRAHPLLEGLRLKSGKECRVKALVDDLLALSANTENSLEALKQCLHRSGGRLVHLGRRNLADQWELSTPQDVWVAIMIQPFLAKRIKSKFWSDIIYAWQKCKPDRTAEPTTRSEVLKQHLFENPLLLNKDGNSFKASSGAGAYGMKWIQRGVARVEDIWEEDTGQWISRESLKVKLGRLPEQEGRLADLIQAIPEEWKDMLGPCFIPLIGTWYKRSDGAKEEFVRLTEWNDDVPGKCSLQVHERERAGDINLREVGSCTSYGVSALEEIRVTQVAQRQQAKPTKWQLVANGAAYAESRVDISRWGWEVGSEVIWGLGNCSTVLTQRIRAKEAQKGEKLRRDGKRNLPSGNLDPPSSKDLQKLWNQLTLIPSQKLASLLWLQSHQAIPTARWLRKRGLLFKEACDRCSWLFEMMHHLWWACPKSRKWWDWWSAHWIQWSGRKDLSGESWTILGILPEGVRPDKGWGYVAQIGRAVLLWVIWAVRNELRLKGNTMPEAQAEKLFRKLLKNEALADGRRKAERGRRRSGTQWFKETWGQNPAVLQVSEDNKLKFSLWWDR